MAKDYKYTNQPEPTAGNILSLYRDPNELYAPDWWRRLIAGRSLDRQPWATKTFQALVYAGLLSTLGYGSRKLLRGTSQEAQDALKAIDKYVPQGEDPTALDTSRLVKKSEYKSPKDKAKDALKRVFAWKGATDTINSLSYAVPPAAAIMAWLVGQKLAEKEIEGTDLSDSKARLAKARSDYNRTLAKKLNPKVKLPEMVIQDRVQNPVDYAIDKGIEAKNTAVQSAKNFLFGKKAGDGDVDEIQLRPTREVQLDELRKRYANNPTIGRFLYTLAENTGFIPLLAMGGAAAFLGSGLYGWNNARAKDKNLQKALDREAAVKRRAAEMNDQRLDVAKIFKPGVEGL